MSDEAAVERLTLVEAGRLFVPPISKKAVEQLVQRGALHTEKDIDPATGKTTLRWTTRAWLEEYVGRSDGRRRLRDGELPVARSGRRVASRDAHPDSPWRRVAEELIAENRELRTRLAEMETERP